MRSKRLFAALLAFVMVFSVLSPAANAASVEKNKPGIVATNKGESSSINNNLVISGANRPIGGNTLRDKELLNVDVQENNAVNGNGIWNATQVDGKFDLPMTEIPDHIQELKEAAEVFAKDEKVMAFVVMEAAPLAERYNSVSRVTSADENQLLSVQNKVIKSIEKTVLSGRTLNVRYQFTYLTNSFSVETEFENLAKIAQIDGVKSVFVMPVYEPCTTASPNTAAAGAMTGVHTVWQELGYTGEGMKIAVIDTGLDLDHPSFAAAPQLTDSSMTMEDIEAVLKDLNAYSRRSTITAKTLYRSAKVPFAFNYVDGNLTADHSADEQGDHGTHVAGIAAANKLETTSVVGMAPDAQIIVMKVFGAAGGAYTDDIVAALEDAMTLGCDVVNASLGSPAGFSSSDSEIDLIYQRLASQDIVATISAGNEGTSSYDNMWGTDLNRTQNPDNATIGSPSIYANTFSIASAENSEVMTDFFSLADGTKIFFQDSIEAIYAAAGYPEYIGAVSLKALADMDLEYVFVPNLGTAEDVASVDVAGKIAVISRGEISFSEKVMNAEAAGALGVIIWNTNDTDDIYTFGMTTTNQETGEMPGIPSAIVTLSAGKQMYNAETKTMKVAKDQAPRACEGGQMSSFSSWGVTPDLQLRPDITGIGGNVYSCYDGGVYGLMSGTSMSAPQVAGVTALVMQRLYELYPDAPDGTIRELAMALMMSTADPIISSVSGVEASTRQQGAGLVNAYEAVTSEVYLTVGGNRPKAELGDNENGVYMFSFEIHNIGNEAKTYTMNASLLTEYVQGMRLSATEVEYFMYGENIPLSGDVSFDKDSVTVPAGGKADVKVTITLSAADKAYFENYWENGGYVEGFVYLYNEEGAAELNLPFMGFYGDWTEAPVFDTAYWYDNSFWSLNPANGLPEGDEYYNVIWTSLMGTDWVLGMNPYSGAVLDANRNIYYDPAHNILSPNGDGVLDGISEMYLSLLRNAKTLTFTYTSEGEILHRETITNNSKTMYRSSYGQIIPWIYSWYGIGAYNFKGLETGTEVLLTIDANVDYGTGGDHTIEIPITIDVTKPQLLNVFEMKDEASGLNLLAVQVYDETALASVQLLNNSGTQLLDEAYDIQLSPNGDGTYLAFFDVTDKGTEFMVAVCDYGCNESYYSVKYTQNGDNAPDMSAFADKLFAYRCFDDHIVSDHMYGWVMMEQPAEGETAFINVFTDDYLEYAAINAAEYAGGKIFAVDAVYNLVVITPGVWNRSTICNLGMNVLDMTFDDSTDTMYVLTKSDSYVGLYTMDLMTGELELVKDLGYYYYAPLAITDDDNGTLYAIAYGKANLYTLDAEYKMVPVKTVVDEVETDLVITDSYGSKVKPNIAQSIAYVDGNIYWAYLNYSDWGSNSDLICIDTESWTFTNHPYQSKAYDANQQLVDYYPATELVGLLTLNETDYTLPEAEELLGLVMNPTNAVLTVGESLSLSATASPWNYALGELTWSTSDKSVATVVNGSVVAVGEGTAMITVTHGEGENAVSASCEIKVVDVSSNFYAYNYYSNDGNYGYMINVDTGAMDYSILGTVPTDFIAGDYNGHDGYFYGYNEYGQFWKLNMTTGESAYLGSVESAMVPTDMAYDYSTGMMYAATVNESAGYSSLCEVSLNNGQLNEVAQLPYVFLMTLACDGEGNIYALTYDGMLVQLMEMYDDWTEEYVWMPMPLMENLGVLQYAQSMCWDHKNDVLIWAYPEASTLIWLDINENLALSLGDPTASGLFEFVGMFTVPAEIEPLAPVAVESVIANDMLLINGTTKVPNVNVYPFNANSWTMSMVSANPAVATVNADGTITAVAEGTTTVAVTIVDGENTFEATFSVTVINGADDIYGHVLTDFATNAGQYWVRIYAQDTANPDNLSYMNYILYAEEYYNGKLYAVGYDPYDWEGNWQMFVMDPTSHAVLEQVDLGEGYPFVYDMTYDYNTSTMYCLAGPSETDAALYAFNMETGALTFVMQPDQFFMSLAAGPNGVLYAMENSAMEEVVTEDEWGWEEFSYVFTNAKLYTIDPISGEIELVGDTGIKSNMLTSLAYDYDTDRLYWTPLFRESFFSPVISTFAVVDPATGAANSLGSVGTAGAQISGLYIISEKTPAENANVLHDLIVTPSKTVVSVGESVTASAVTLPMSLNAKVTWTSSNTKVATVDAAGKITGVSQGKATITATVTVNGVTKTAACEVVVLDQDASFLAYNATKGGWAAISRADATNVTTLTEGEEIGVSAITSIDGVVYGYDAENNFFCLDTKTFERTVIGAVDSAAHIAEFLVDWGFSEEDIEMESENYAFDIRDMDYDAANDRILVLGNVCDVYGDELNMGNRIYEVNMEDGTLKLLYTFEDIYSVMAIAVDPNGNVIHYNAYDDYYTTLNLETGASKRIVTMQSQSFYGDTMSDHGMYYDVLTGMVYHTFTSNGYYYSLFSMDPETGALTQVSEYVGSVEYNDDLWVDVGEKFHGLTFVYVDLDSVENPFVDVKADAYYADAVKWAIKFGVTNGTSATTFDPNKCSTRADVVTFLYRAAGSPSVEGLENPFVDVKESAYYYDAVLWAVNNGITNGTSELFFSPSKICTRAETVTFIYRAAGAPAVEGQENPFNDVAENAYYYDAVLWAVSEGITDGVSATVFAPASCCTRAQVVTMLYRDWK